MCVYSGIYLIAQGGGGRTAPRTEYLQTNLQITIKYANTLFQLGWP